MPQILVYGSQTWVIRAACQNLQNHLIHNISPPTTNATSHHHHSFHDTRNTVDRNTEASVAHAFHKNPKWFQHLAIPAVRLHVQEPPWQRSRTLRFPHEASRRRTSRQRWRSLCNGGEGRLQDLFPLFWYSNRKSQIMTRLRISILFCLKPVASSAWKKNDRQEYKQSGWEDLKEQHDDIQGGAHGQLIHCFSRRPRENSAQI